MPPKPNQLQKPQTAPSHDEIDPILSDLFAALDNAFNPFPDDERKKKAKELTRADILKTLDNVLRAQRNTRIVSLEPAIEILHERIRDASKKYAQQLQEQPTGAIDKSSMGVDTQRIIEQAQAEAASAEVLTHPEPDTRAALGAMATEVAQLNKTVAALDELGLSHTPTAVQTVVSGLHRIAKLADGTAWQVGFNGIDRDDVSQTQVAEWMDSSSPTVSRRYNKRFDQSEEPRE